MNVVDIATFTTNATRAFETSLVQLADAVFGGHVVDPGDPQRKFTVEILADGYVLQTVRADLPALSGAGDVQGDGCHAFMFSLPASAIEPGVIVEARLANLGTPVGNPIAIDVDRPATLEQGGAGSLTWLGGLRFSASISDRDLAAVGVVVDGEAVLQAPPTGWASVDDGHGRTARTFDFHLPDRLADGALHRVAIRDNQGEMIGGAPLPFVAFADGLAAAIAVLGAMEDERPRAELFDRLLPTSWPMARYAEWRDRLPVATLPERPEKIAVILTGAGSPDETVESLESQTGARWVAAALPDSGDAFSFAPELMKGFLAGDGADCTIIVLAPSGTRFAPNALQRLASEFDVSAETFAVYGDLEVRGDDGAPWPLFFPAFDYERMLEQGYCSLVFAIRRAHLERALEAGASDLFRVFNAQLDVGNAGADGIAHVPGAIATLPRFNTRTAGKTLAAAGGAHLGERDTVAETVAGKGAGLLPSVRISRRPTPDANVAVVIMTDGKNDALGACLAAILPEARRHNAEIIIADTRYGHARTAAALAGQDGVAATVVTVDGPFNQARMANLAVRSTGRDHLCLMADDVTEADGGWLSELLGRIADPCVGAVSPLAVGVDGLVRDAGVVLGPGFAMAPAFANANASDVGYGAMLAIAHQRSALDMGCLLTWRGDYLAVGGMDEMQFADDFAAVDYCLKLRAARRRIVMTPHARIVRSGKPRAMRPEAVRHADAALRALRARWGEALAADPYYSPLLALDASPYSALAWPARAAPARRAEPPAPTSIPPGF